MQTEIAAKIKKVREIKGFSQDYLAEKLGISQSAYSRIEKNEINITLEKLDKIAGILEIPTLDLINFNEHNIFNNCNLSGNFGNNSTYNAISDETRKLYEERIKQLEKENDFLRKIIEKRF